MYQIPKGTKNFDKRDTWIRNNIFNKLISIFERRQAVRIETPIIENFNTVKNIYGEEFNKQVYKISNNGNENENKNKNENENEKLLLRFDLTVPRAIFCANNRFIKKKTYQIGKVFRRDQPRIKNGRYREFYQCDFDITGNNSSFMQELEILSTLSNALDTLIGKNYTIKINDKQILHNILSKCEIDMDSNNDMFHKVCSTIDKLGKISNKQLFQELIQKNVTIESVNILENIFNELDKTDKDNVLTYLYANNIIDKYTYDELSNLLQSLSKLGINNIIVSPVLARGLDYYTGLIYEAEYNNKKIMGSSIAAGGRYDNMLTDMYGKGTTIQSIGFSIGIERIVTILEKTKSIKNNDNNKNIIYIASISPNDNNDMDMNTERMLLAEKLRCEGFDIETSYLSNPSIKKQLKEVLQNNISFMIIIGEYEINNDMFKIKILNLREEYHINKEDIVAHLKSIIL